MTKVTNGYASSKGAVAAAKKVLGKDAILGAEFEVYPLADTDGRYDWKAIERKKVQRKGSGKANPFSSRPLAEAQLLLPEVEDKQPTPQEVAEAEAALEARAKVAAEQSTKQAKAEPEPTPANIEGADHTPSKAASAFGAFAMGALGNGVERRAENAGGTRRANDKPAGEKKVRVPPTIVNGVRQPSPGTVCRAVWDELEKIRDAQDGVPPNSKQVKALAEAMKWNANNASIEFYQWRKFNGITGRSKADAPAAKPVKPKSE
jgi:hypothetical protein